MFHLLPPILDPSPPTPARRVADGLLALLHILAAAAIAWPLREHIDLADIVMLFLLAVFLAALRLGRGAALLAALLAVGVFDFAFVPPHFELIPTAAKHLVTLAVMLLIALLTAQLTIGLREQARLALNRERDTQRLYQLARDLAAAASPWEVQAAIDDLFRGSGVRAVLRLEGDGQAPAGIGAPLSFPLDAPGYSGGAMMVTGGDGRATDRALFEAVASLCAIAVARLHSVENAQQAHIAVAAERLRGSILSTLSHDLRTPLTALVGMADGLALARDPDPRQVQEAAAAIRDQALGMHHLLGNLLDMARLQGGQVRLRKEWQLCDDLIGAALRSLRGQLARHPVRVHLAPELPLVEFDAVLMERVLCNLVENAAKYSPPETPIEIEARVEGDHAIIEVCDRGRGLPTGDPRRLFEPFVRGDPESVEPGVGMGLAICRAILEAHGGTLGARSRDGGGACFWVTLPLGAPPPLEEEPA